MVKARIRAFIEGRFFAILTASSRLHGVGKPCCYLAVIFGQLLASSWAVGYPLHIRCSATDKGHGNTRTYLVLIFCVFSTRERGAVPGASSVGGRLVPNGPGKKTRIIGRWAFHHAEMINYTPRRNKARSGAPGGLCANFWHYIGAGGGGSMLHRVAALVPGSLQLPRCFNQTQRRSR